MLRALLLQAFFIATVAWGQVAGPLVTLAQVDAAIARVNATAALDSPDSSGRASLLKLYSDTRAALRAVTEYQGEREKYARARAEAGREATAIEAGLAERQVVPTGIGGALETASLGELEQQIQVSRSELEARKAMLAETRSAISGMPGRAIVIRDRLTVLGTLIPDLQSAQAALSSGAEPGSENEARLWLAQASSANAVAEKEALNEELLSQPMRLQLLSATQDRASQDVAALERQLQAIERRASFLRQGQATQALVEAEKEQARTQGKHVLVQRLADRNAELSASFVDLGSAIEASRARELSVQQQAERLETDLQSIAHKLSVLGMSTEVGQVLREQQIQLPQERESNKQIALVGKQVTSVSIRQIELEDERRKLLDAGAYVEKLVSDLEPGVAETIRPDLLELARKRRELVRQALDLENLYAGTLGNLQYNMYEYARVVKDYRRFTEERLLWITSRDPFSLFRANGLPVQLAQIFAIERWVGEAHRLPAELLQQPLTALALALVLVLVYRSPSLKSRIVASGREVGYVRTDNYSHTLLALVLSALLSVKWPLLMWAVARLFGMQDTQSELALALHDSLVRGAVYFWGLEFLRISMLPKGLVSAHFRWPTQRASQTYARIVVLERSFLPAVILVYFCLSMYPREVGGPLAAVGVIVLLLSMSYFFRHVPHYMQGKVGMLLTERVHGEGSTLGSIMRQVLVWVPVITILAVVLGYIYTAMMFSLLLIKSGAVCALVMLGNELAMRWLRMTRRRMLVRARAEATQAVADEAEISPEEEALENDPELLGDEGTKLINLLTLFGLLGGIVAVWAEAFPAMAILDSVQLWQQSGVVEGQQVLVPVTLADVARALAILVVGWVAVRRVPALLEILLRQKMGVRPASAYAATSIFQYAVTGALIVGVLGALGGSWAQIQWAVAALSVGIGFGMQEIVANFICGLIILFEQPIRVGDTVTVGNVSGKVTRIRIRATTIRDFDRRELLVPNKEFITQQLLNWSLSDQVTRSAIEVGVAYGTDLDRAIAIVREAAHQHPIILKDPEPIVTFEQFGDNSLLIRVRFFMDQLDARLVTSSELMLDINRRLDKAGIVVAFPQRDVHLDTSKPLEIRMMEREQAPAPGPPPG